MHEHQNIPSINWRAAKFIRRRPWILDCSSFHFRGGLQLFKGATLRFKQRLPHFGRSGNRETIHQSKIWICFSWIFNRI